MSDLESREDREIRECLQKAYGYSDEQLLRKLEDAEDSLKETDFPGAEKRIFQKLMERKATEEAAQNDKGEGNEEDRENEKLPAAVEIRKTDIEDTEMDAPAGPKKKSVLSGRRKLFFSAALVAVFMIALGITAIGERSNFFNSRRNRVQVNVVNNVVNNDLNRRGVSKLEDAYLQIKDDLNIEPLKLGYCPSKLLFKDIILKRSGATIYFLYDENIITLYANRSSGNNSIGIDSDREEEGTIFNQWLDIEIEYFGNMLENGEVEYEAMIIAEDNLYYFSGILPEEEFVKIIENFYL